MARWARRQGISPGPAEAIVTITYKHGHLADQVDLDDGHRIVACSGAAREYPTLVDAPERDPAGPR